jgi:crotonobetaine/carnitine-CoA ligase
MKSLEVLNLYSQHNGTLSSLLESRVNKNSEKECLLFENKRSVLWKDFYSWVAGLSQYLSEKNIQKNSRVITILPNSDLNVALYFAINDLGAINIPLNPDLTLDEYTYLLNHADPAIVIVGPELIEKISQIKRSPLILLTEEKFFQLRASKLKNLGTADDTGLILYTSGTTGFPKGVMHSQKTSIMAGEAFVERMHLQPSERILCILPLFHINALFYSMMGSFAAGATLIINQKFSASKFWSLASDTKATQVNIIAAIGNILAKRNRNEWRSDHCLKKIYGAPVSKEISHVFTSEFKIPIILEGYGMTEIPGALNNQIEGKSRIGTMGVEALHPNPNLTLTEVKIIDEDENQVRGPTKKEAGEMGELVVKTPLLMQGYYKDSEQTKKSFTKDGWFKTGDYAFKDSDGFYVFCSRKKDIIRKKGENISGAELDRVIATCPQVLEVATIGVPSSLGEEEILVALVKEDKSLLCEKDIRKWCEEKLPPHKWPRYICFVKELPHTPTQRVAKYKLKNDPTILTEAKEFD